VRQRSRVERRTTCLRKRAGDVDVVVEREDGEFNVVVRDAGQGMRRRSSRREANGGYGLKIIEKISARMTITSAGNAGTELRMVFALAGQAPEGTQPS